MFTTTETWAVEVTRDDGWNLGFAGLYNTRKAARAEAKRPRTDGWTAVRVVRVRFSIEVIEGQPRLTTATTAIGR